MPPISEPGHGMLLAPTDQHGPTAQELKAVQDACLGDANLMCHGRQCRADTAGLLSEDRCDEFTLDKIDKIDKALFNPVGQQVRTPAPCEAADPLLSEPVSA